MSYSKEEILRGLNITEEVIAIIPYGSRVYGTYDNKSDHDYIIVTKGSVLSNGSFKNNAISNSDYTIQGVLYSRSGFISAIDDYEIGAMECVSLDEEDYIHITPLFKKFVLGKVRTWNEKEMVKKVIQKASSSRHIADKQAQTGYKERAKRGMFHALRILMFGLDLKEYREIINFTKANELFYKFKSISPDDFDTRDWYGEFDRLLIDLRK